jgi:arylsulfatase A-like enzyme
VIYTSDQGFYLGENGWFDKRFAYDVSMQTPLLVRWPDAIKPGFVSNTMVQNIDFAPTLLDMAGAKIPNWMQGVSIKQLLMGRQRNLARKSLYYHYYEFGKDHTVLPHIAVRSDQYKLIYFYTVNEWELYNLVSDPAEQKNIVKSKMHQGAFLQMKSELKRLRDVYEDHEPAGEFK